MTSTPKPPPAKTPPEGMSLSEIAERLGVSRPRAAQLVEAATRKFRAECHRRGLDPAAFF